VFEKYLSEIDLKEELRVIAGRVEGHLRRKEVTRIQRKF